MNKGSIQLSKLLLVSLCVVGTQRLDISAVASGQAPLVPYDPLPTDGMVDVNRASSVRWHCSDPDSPVLEYDVYFGTSSPPPLVATAQPLIYYTPSGPLPLGSLEPNRLYYWKIVARDPDNNVTEGPIWSYTTSGSNLPPQTPYNPSPANNATDLPLSLKLRWSSSDPEQLGMRYDVYFGPDASPPLVAANIETASYFVGGLLETTDYHWKIVARDVDGNEAVGPMWTFRTIANPYNDITLGLYSDALGSLCPLADSGSGIRKVYVILDGPGTFTGCRFAAPIPSCFDATWVADNTSFVSLGTSPQDVSVAFGACLTPPILVMDISYASTGSTTGCCSFPLTATALTGLIVADCGFVEHDVRSFPVLGISSDDGCPACGAVRVQESTWGSVKALYR